MPVRSMTSTSTRGIIPLGTWAVPLASHCSATGFTRPERDAHIRRVGWVASRLEAHGVVAVTSLVSPYRDSQRQLVGAVGVIGPSRLNYARIIPMVDYTAKVIGRILG